MGKKPTSALGASGELLSTIVREKIQAFLTAYEHANVKALADLFSENDPHYVGTGAHEFQYGQIDILNQFKSDFEQSRPEQRVMRLGEVIVSPQLGLIGCLARLEYCPEAGTVPMRVSGFLVHEADEWRWASMHFSFPAAEQSPGDSIPLPPSSPIAIEALRKQFGRESVDLLWIAESEVARNAVLKGLRACDGESIWRIDGPGGDDYLGRFGAFDIVLTQCSAGENQVEQTLERWNPKLVVISGVALRLNEVEIHRGPGDVVISQRIVPHGNGKHAALSPRRKTALHAHMQKRIESWQYSGGDTTLDFRCYEGPLLSGDEFPNESSRDELSGRFPESIGFELQSAGICTAINSRGVDWIVAKGICDWGGLQPENQVLPAATAVDFMRHVFSDRTVLDVTP